jgi:hypothetical protein
MGFISKFLLKPMGVLATGSGHARPSARPPINISDIFWLTCLVCDVKNTVVVTLMMINKSMFINWVTSSQDELDDLFNKTEGVFHLENIFIFSIPNN